MSISANIEHLLDKIKKKASLTIVLFLLVRRTVTRRFICVFHNPHQSLSSDEIRIKIKKSITDAYGKHNVSLFFFFTLFAKCELFSFRNNQFSCLIHPSAARRTTF